MPEIDGAPLAEYSTLGWDHTEIRDTLNNWFNAAGAGVNITAETGTQAFGNIEPLLTNNRIGQIINTEDATWSFGDLWGDAISDANLTEFHFRVQVVFNVLIILQDASNDHEYTFNFVDIQRLTRGKWVIHFIRTAPNRYNVNVHRCDTPEQIYVPYVHTNSFKNDFVDYFKLWGFGKYVENLRQNAINNNALKLVAGSSGALELHRGTTTISDTNLTDLQLLTGILPTAQEQNEILSAILTGQAHSEFDHLGRINTIFQLSLIHI